VSKIVLLTHIQFPAVDGGSKVILKIGEYLQKKGHLTQTISSNCFSSDDFSKFKPLTHPHGLPVITILFRPLRLIGKIFPSLLVFSKGPIFSLFPFLKTIIFLKKWHPDIIIAGPFPTTIPLYALLLKKITKAKLIIIPCFHPTDSDFQNRFLKSVFNQSDYILALTNTEKKIISQISSSKIFVSPLGVDSNFLIDPQKINFPQDPNILFIANFSAHKRTELLINTFKILSKKYPHLSLTLLGQKTLYWPKIEKHLLKTPKINLIFNPSQNQIKTAIDKSTLLCLPSIHESFGLVFIESLARGKPIVGANTPQTTEVISSLKGGLTFSTDSVNDLINTLNKLLSSPALCQHLGQNGFQQVKNHYTWDKIVNNLCPILNI
jgi:glycosyltransferase involved in cell wall biosynthesis